MTYLTRIAVIADTRHAAAVAAQFTPQTHPHVTVHAAPLERYDAPAGLARALTEDVLLLLPEGHALDDAAPEGLRELFADPALCLVSLAESNPVPQQPRDCASVVYWRRLFIPAYDAEPVRSHARATAAAGPVFAVRRKTLLDLNAFTPHYKTQEFQRLDFCLRAWRSRLQCRFARALTYRTLRPAPPYPQDENYYHDALLLRHLHSPARGWWRAKHALLEGADNRLDALRGRVARRKGAAMLRGTLRAHANELRPHELPVAANTVLGELNQSRAITEMEQPSQWTALRRAWWPHCYRSPHRNMLMLVGRGNRVLETGCNTGYMTAFLRDAGNTVVGVELDAAAAEQARAFAEQVVIGDLQKPETWEQFAGEFDVVTFGDVLEHLFNPEDALRRAKTALKPAGRICVSIPNVAHWSIRGQALRGKFEYTQQGILAHDHLRFFTHAVMLQLFAATGLTVERTLHSCRFPRWLEWMPGRLPWLGPRLLTWLGDTFPRLFAMQFQFALRGESGAAPG